jgi:ribosomal protein S27AE
VTVQSLHQTLDQELVAILRRASLECPVCGEFLLHRSDGIGCPQCGLELGGEAAGGGLELGGEAVAVDARADAPAL